MISLGSCAERATARGSKPSDAQKVNNVRRGRASFSWPHENDHLSANAAVIEDVETGHRHQPFRKDVDLTFSPT